jgi:hypothetical protein
MLYNIENNILSKQAALDSPDNQFLDQSLGHVAQFCKKSLQLKTCPSKKSTMKSRANRKHTRQTIQSIH